MKITAGSGENCTWQSSQQDAHRLGGQCNRCPAQLPLTCWGAHSPAAFTCDVLRPLPVVKAAPWRLYQQHRSGCRRLTRGYGRPLPPVQTSRSTVHADQAKGKLALAHPRSAVPSLSCFPLALTSVLPRYIQCTRILVPGLLLGNPT